MNPELYPRRKKTKKKVKDKPAEVDAVGGVKESFWRVPTKDGVKIVPVPEGSISIINGRADAPGPLVELSESLGCRWLTRELELASDTSGVHRAALLNGCELVVGDLIESLTEATLPELNDYTASNGFYNVGGLRRVAGVWVIDPEVTNRVQNSTFVAVNPPQWEMGEDGFPILRFRCRSRPDRSTTGLVHSGHIRVVSRDSWLRRVGARLLGSRFRIEPQVQVYCSCQDFKYRFHYVLAQMGAAATPTGVGGEATNQPPDQTNPSRRPSLCKHLAAVSALVDFNSPQFRDLRRMTGVIPVAPGQSPIVEPGSQIS